MNPVIVPPLKGDDRISDWTPLFTAAVSSLLTKNNGQKLAIGMLPASHGCSEPETKLSNAVVAPRCAQN